MKVVVYTTDTCPKCQRLKEYLISRGISFSIKDMQDIKNRAILMSMNVFTVTAPVLDADGTYLTCDELFDGNELNTQRIDFELYLTSGME